MNFLWVSPHYPPNFQTFIEALDNTEMTVLGIGQEPYDHLSDVLKEHLTEYFRVDDLENREEVIRAVAFLIYKHGPIDRVESNNEHWLELDATIREQFNIAGLRPNDLIPTRYKSEMKRSFKACDAPVVDGELIATVSEIDEAIEALGGLPVIAKPDSGVGASATYKLESKADVADFKQSWAEEVPYFLEPFVSGELCTYDGLLDQEGNIVFEASFTHNIPTLDIMNESTDMYIVIDREVDPKLREIGRRILSEFNMTERFFHLEFFRLPDGNYITLEYNNRMAGGFVIDAYNHLFSHDLFKHYALVVKDEAFDNPHFKKRLGVVVTRRNETNYQHSLDEIYQHYGDRVRGEDAIRGIIADMQGDQWMLITCEDKSEIDEIVEFTQATK